MERDTRRRSPAPTVPTYRQTQETSLSLDELFSVLASKRRRCLLYALRDEGGTASVETLRDRLVDWETEGGDEADHRHRRELTLTLAHTHLPKLDRVGVVEYEEHTGTVRYRENPLVEQWLVRTRELDGV